jgi:hypothetical protein
VNISPKIVRCAFLSLWSGLLIVAISLPGCQPSKTASPEAVKTGAEKTKAPASAQSPAKPSEPAAKPAEPTEPKAPETAKTGEEKTAAKPVEEKKTEKQADDAGKTAAPVEPPAPPKVSTFAPAEDLVAQADKLAETLDTDTATEEAFKDADTNIARNANLLALTAVALGLHDQDNKYKPNAGAVYEAATKLAAAKGFAAAKPAAAELKAATEGKGKAGASQQLKWSDAPALTLLWPQAESLKTNLPTDKTYKKRLKNAPRNSATIAVIGQAAVLMPETKTPEETKQWIDFAVEMRDAAAALNAAAHAKDEKAVVAARDKLDKNCNDCHAVFRKEEKK